MDKIKDFPEVSDADVAFGGYPKDWFKKVLTNGIEDKDRKWNDLFIRLFFEGGSVPVNREYPKEYTDKGLRMLKAVMGSFEPAHEDKKVVCAVILKNLCE